MSLLTQIAQSLRDSRYGKERQPYGRYGRVLFAVSFEHGIELVWGKSRWLQIARNARHPHRPLFAQGGLAGGYIFETGKWYILSTHAHNARL